MPEYSSASKIDPDPRNSNGCCKPSTKEVNEEKGIGVRGEAAFGLSQLFYKNVIGLI
jgi:hypothetical protein